MLLRWHPQPSIPPANPSIDDTVPDLRNARRRIESPPCSFRLEQNGQFILLLRNRRKQRPRRGMKNKNVGGGKAGRHTIAI